MADIDESLRSSALPYLRAFFSEKNALPQAMLIIGANGSGKSAFCRALAEEIIPHIYGHNVVIAYATGNHFADSLEGMDPGIIRVEPLTNAEFRDLGERLVDAKKHGSTAAYVLICDDLLERIKPESPGERFALLSRNARAIPIYTFHCIGNVPSNLLSSVPYKFFLSFGRTAKLSESLRPVVQFPYPVTKNEFASAISKALCVDGSIILWTSFGPNRLIIFKKNGFIGDHIALVSDYKRKK